MARTSTHSHHRGQATTLLKQAGVDPGVTDLPWAPLARDAAGRIVLAATARRRHQR